MSLVCQRQRQEKPHPPWNEQIYLSGENDTHKYTHKRKMLSDNNLLYISNELHLLSIWQKNNTSILQSPCVSSKFYLFGPFATNTNYKNVGLCIFLWFCSVYCGQKIKLKVLCSGRHLSGSIHSVKTILKVHREEADNKIFSGTEFHSVIIQEKIWAHFVPQVFIHPVKKKMNKTLKEFSCTSVCNCGFGCQKCIGFYLNE